ncbi:MAG: FAD-dependent oxidoreductase [Rhodospirillales bacterium]|nr:FAD-dependent oxidoreductase [Rhodospirillales bacterium]
MVAIKRRKFLNGLMTAGALVAAPRSFAGARAHVVIVGGGVGGIAAARHLATHYPEIAITMIEANPAYTCCFSSGAVLADLRERSSLDFAYDRVRQTDAIKWINARATRIDVEKSVVHLSEQETVAYDRLIVAPGIGLDFDQIDGFDGAAQVRFPHSYVLGGDIDLLKSRLAAVEDGGLVVLSVPARPYRCTPAPYERVSMIAHYLKSHKPKSKILVLDNKDEFPLMDRILPAWDRFYGGMIEWVPLEFGGQVERVNGADGSLVYDGQTIRPDLANVIPPQRAGDIARASGLSADDGWCPVDPVTLQSLLAGNVHVIGDAAEAGDMSKSAHAAASMGDVCAAAVGRLLTGRDPMPPAYDNACYFLIAPNHGLQVGGAYQAEHGRITGTRGFSSAIGETDMTRAATAAAGDRWFGEFTDDLFG